MKALFRRRRRHEDGWFAISMRPGALDFAHGVSNSGRCRITRCGSRKTDDGERALERIGKELELHRYNCLAMLGMDEYQLLQVDAPNVPPAELKAAVRWRLKDMLDYHINDATIDVLDIPPDQPGGRAHLMYAVAARNEIIQACISKYEAAKIPVSVIDIPEMAQRNVAALYELPDRALAFLHIGPGHSLLTVNYRGELYMARRIEVSANHLLNAPAASADESHGRVLLQLQRSFDHFDRQFPRVGIAKLVLAPEQEESGLAAFLAQNLDLPVEQARLHDVLEVAQDASFGGGESWRLFHLLGASLRAEAKAL